MPDHARWVKRPDGEAEERRRGASFRRGRIQGADLAVVAGVDGAAEDATDLDVVRPRRQLQSAPYRPVLGRKLWEHT